MRSHLPSLYRSLERSGTAKGYDAIAMAATLNFLSIRSASRQPKDAYSRLIEPIWPHLLEETRAHIVERLCGHPNLPETVANLISGYAPVSASCDESEGGPNAATASEDDAKAVAREAMSVLADRRSMDNTPTVTAKSAEEARQTLRAFVAAPPRSQTRKRPIIQIAQSRDRIALRDFLAANLSLSASDCESLLDPTNLPDLAAALKALGLSTADAMTVLMFVDSTVSTNMATFAIAKNHYERLSLEHVAARFGVQEKPAAQTPALQPASADLLTPIRSTAPRRAAFGRRTDNQNRRNGTGTGH